MEGFKPSGALQERISAARSGHCFSCRPPIARLNRC